jgi:hypothetical protein
MREAPAFVLGVDPARLRPVLPLLGPDVCFLQGDAAGHALLRRLDHSMGGLVVVGPNVHDLTLAETIKRIRARPETRQVSILALSSREASDLPGANIVLPLATDVATLSAWINKLSRVPPRVKVQARVSGRAAGGTVFHGVSQDISLAGMRLVTADAVPAATDLDLWIELLSGQTLVALGRVIRAEIGAYGIEFLCLPPDTQELIDQLVDGAETPLHIVRSPSWICEILRPTVHGEQWQSEVRRARTAGDARERFLTVVGGSAEEAVEKAREVARAWIVASSAS